MHKESEQVSVKINLDKLKIGVLLTFILLPFISKGQLSGDFFSKPAEWYGSEEATRIADNILLFQRNDGGWPKEWPHKKDYLKEYTVEEKEKLYGMKNKRDGTFDNGATWKELRYLAKVGNASNSSQYRLAFHRGLDYMLEAQYPNGGWPQFHPGLEKYSPGHSQYSPDGIERYITFNDGAMTQVVWLLKDVSENAEDFGFVNDQRRRKAVDAVARGIDCILKSQFVYDGALTGWPAQVDERTFEPRWGRDFEPASIDSRETVGIVRFLMSIEEPDDKIIAAIQGAVQWLDEVKVMNIRIEKSEEMIKVGGNSERRDEYMVEDPDAPPMWARMYELNTFRPIFSSRGDAVRYKLSKISLERRTGYSWYGRWAQRLMSEEYPQWCRKHRVENVLE